MALFSTEIAIPICAVIGIAFALVLWRFGSHIGADHADEERGLRREDKARVKHNSKEITEAVNKELTELYLISSHISRRSRIRLLLYLLDIEAKILFVIATGVSDFLRKEYLYVFVLVVAFAILIILFLGIVERFSTQSRPFTFCPSNTCKPALAIAVSFLIGALTSALSGFLGMKIVVDSKGSFNAAFRSGAAMGFLMAAMSLLGLYIAIKLFKCYYGNDWEGLFEVITGYGLGASSMAFFGRAAGGIYAKAVDVYLDLVSRNSQDYEDYRSLSVIPCDVGDIVGDIAGMGTDLFGSYAESCCAALVVASISSFGIDHNFTAMCYPLLISSMGILVCLISTLFTAYFSDIREVGKEGDMRPALKKQLIISTVLMTFGIAIVSSIALPSSFKIYYFGMEKVVTKWQLSFCAVFGLLAGSIIELFPEYHTNDCIRNIQRVVTDAGVPLASVCAVLTSVLTSVIIPICADISFSVGFSIAAAYGIAVAALGMLSTIATRLAIDAYDPISRYAERIAVTAPRQSFRNAGNPPAAAGKGFAIESAVLVFIALFSAFVSRAAISHIEVRTPKVLVGFIGGCILTTSLLRQ
ncbi:pyrophosphate-energized vacuolar membrane proton pump 1-like [Eucalyptus grandis]|uniref:pyrophosphate-energized vacuolar membrane proton pump 1-like n=1 Tax=Eucalyptus grandis TaxID=71139 RepID=UPI00192E961F|nr:pyrophosphate-energized vacuolar membrane proton pump 1-like [Eucalyptus grandis]